MYHGSYTTCEGCVTGGRPRHHSWVWLERIYDKTECQLCFTPWPIEVQRMAAAQQSKKGGGKGSRYRSSSKDQRQTGDNEPKGIGNQALETLRQCQARGMVIPGIEYGQLPASMEVEPPQLPPASPINEEPEQRSRRIKSELGQVLGETTKSRAKLVGIRSAIRQTESKLAQQRTQEKEEETRWRELQEQAAGLSRKFTAAIEVQFSKQTAEATKHEGDGEELSSLAAVQDAKRQARSRGELGIGGQGGAADSSSNRMQTENSPTKRKEPEAPSSETDKWKKLQEEIYESWKSNFPSDLSKEQTDEITHKISGTLGSLAEELKQARTALATKKEEERFRAEQSRQAQEAAAAEEEQARRSEQKERQAAEARAEAAKLADQVLSAGQVGGATEMDEETQAPFGAAFPEPLPNFPPH